ncbi:MAG: hypothetical protein V1659_05945 [Candidatus Woesearchaeota archaeon]
MAIRCNECEGKCCRYIAVEVDAPEGMGDFEDMLWWLYHENVMLYIDDEHDWILEFRTPCRHLLTGEDVKKALETGHASSESHKHNGFAWDNAEHFPKSACAIHKKRPKMCRTHDYEECEVNGEGDYYLAMFDNAEQLEKIIPKYLETLKECKGDAKKATKKLSESLKK